MTTSWDLDEEEQDSEVHDDSRIIDKYMQVWRYHTDSPTRPTLADVCADIGLLPGSPFAGDINAIARHANLKGTSEKTRPPFLAYLLTVEWATDAPLPNSLSSDPTERRTIWGGRGSVQQRHVIKDKNGKLIVNTAGQPPDGGVQVDVRLGVVTANRNVTAVGYNPDDVLAMNGQINSETFLGGDPGTVVCEVETSEKYEGAYHYYEESYTFTYDKEGHQPNLASAGFYQRASVGSDNLVRIQQGGEDVLEPEPLDADGVLVPIADRPDSCAFVDVELLDETDFNSLGL